MHTRPTRSRLVRRARQLGGLAAGLALSAVPALADGPADGTPGGFVRLGDAPAAVTPASGEIVGDAACPPGQNWGGVTGHPFVGPTVGGPGLPVPPVPGLGLAAGHLHKFAPDGYITWGEIGAGLRAKPALIPPLGGYDAYLPPDHGFQRPVGYPVQRVPVTYQNWYPNQWYGLPGSQKAAVAPTVFMPTDTTQLGFYHQRVPTWKPATHALPPAPNPRTMHAYAPPAGSDVGVYPGIYPGERRLLGCPTDRHTDSGGTVVTEPGCPVDGGVAGTVSGGVSVDPLPGSTDLGGTTLGEPALPGDTLPGAPAGPGVRPGPAGRRPLTAARNAVGSAFGKFFGTCVPPRRRTPLTGDGGRLGPVWKGRPGTPDRPGGRGPD